MLEITVIWDSAVCDIFAVKCCSFKLLDQNFEVMLKNTGDFPVTVQSHLDLVGDTETRRIRNLMPQGEQTVAPGESVSFYCDLDETVFAESRELVIYDAEGKEHREVLHGTD